MTYVKNTWVDQSVERPKTYEITNNSDGSVTLIDSFGLVSELGTPVNADNMNHIEEGIAACDLRKYDATETYAKYEWVSGIVDNEKSIYMSLKDDNQGSPLTDTAKWKKVNLGGSGSRNIGETVFSLLPISDAGLHLIDGALIPAEGIYRAFVSYIAELYGTGDTHPAYFTTEAEWQASVSTYGVCGKFVYDNSAHTVRLPKVTGLVEGTLDANALGSLVQAGLPGLNLSIDAAGDHNHSKGDMEITGSLNGLDSGGVAQPTATGAFAINNSYYQHGRGETNSLHFNTDFYASHTWTGRTSVEGIHTHTITNNSGSIYGSSNTVQPQTVKGFLYIVLANSTKTDVEVDIDSVVTDLNGKADTSLSNINETGQAKFDAKLNTSLSNLPADSKESITGFGFPSLTKAINMVIGASGAAYNAPADGYIWLMGNCTLAGVCYQSVRQATFICQKVYDQKYDAVALFCPVSKGTFYVDYANMAFTNFRFIYAKGGE